jgi:outer membrane protein TolC
VAGLSLQNAVGLPPGEPVEASGTFRSESPVPMGSAEELVARAIRDRPDLRQMELGVRMRAEQVKVTRADGLPSVELLASGQIDIQSNDFSFQADERHKSWSTGVTLSTPIFDGFEVRSRTAQARVDQKQAALRLEQLRKQVRLEVEQAWYGVEEGRRRVEAGRQAIEEAEEGAAIARRRFSSGVGTQLETLDAELALVRSRAELARGQHDLASALLAAELAVGWNPLTQEGNE